MSEETFEDPIVTVDPESAEQFYAPEDVYTNVEHEATVFSLQHREFAAKGKPVKYWDLAVTFRVDGNFVFAHTEPFGDHCTRSEKFQQSLWPQFVKALGIEGIPASQVEGMAVDVVIGVDTFVRKVDRLTEEELAEGNEPRQSHKNVIKNIMLPEG